MPLKGQGKAMEIRGVGTLELFTQGQGVRELVCTENQGFFLQFWEGALGPF